MQFGAVGRTWSVVDSGSPARATITAVTDPAKPDPALARDHLANERTYLAWLRTSAAVMALGLAVAGLTQKVTVASAIAGSILVATGLAGISYGTTRYRRVTHDLDSGTFVAGGRGRTPVIASGVLSGAVLLALVLIIIGRH
jgi:putative membrane protein